MIEKYRRISSGLPNNSRNIDPFTFYEGQQVIIMQGSGGESTSYLFGKVRTILSPTKACPYHRVLLEGSRELIPLLEGISNMTILNH